MVNRVKLVWVVMNAALVVGCAMPQSRTVLLNDDGVVSARGVVLSLASKSQKPLPIDLSATTVPIESDSTAGIDLIRGVWGALDGTSRHRTYTELRYKDDKDQVLTIDLPEAAKSRYAPGDRITVLHKDGQRTVVNLSQRTRLGLVDQK